MSTEQAFENIGGRVGLIAIKKAFYDKAYKQPWLSS